MVTITTERLGIITPKRFGAVGGARRISGATTTAGSAVLTGPAGSFKPTDVGRPIYVAVANTSGQVLTTTIQAYTSATQVTLATPAVLALTGTAQVLIGEDDTVAVQNAINYAAAHNSRSVLLDDYYITGPLTVYGFSPIVGIGRNASGLVLKPGSATVNKYHVKPASLFDSVNIQNVIFHGMRDFHTDGSGNVLKDIDCINLDYSGATSNNRPGLDNLVIREYGRAAIKLLGISRTTVSDVAIFNCGYGIDLNSNDHTFSNVTAQAYGPAFYLWTSATRNFFSNCRGFRCGYAPVNAVVSEYCCWSLNGATNNHFVNCEGAESWGCVWYLFDAKRNNFTGCRATDAGCLYPADGLGSDNSAQTRAGWCLSGASDDNRFYGCSIGVGSHGTTNYSTHGFYIGNTSSNNTGRIDTDKNSASPSTIGRATSGTGNTVRVNGEQISPDKHMLPIHVSQFFRQLTNGPEAVEVELPTNKIMVSTLNFDPTTPERAQARVPMPSSWDGGPFTFDVKFSQITTGAGGVAWGLKAVALADNYAKDAASGTEVVVTKTAGTGNNEYYTPESTAVTAAGATSGKITLIITITRVVGDAADTLNQDVRLEEVRLYINLKAENDA
jgi:hypothetical protein